MQLVMVKLETLLELTVLRQHDQSLTNPITQSNGSSERALVKVLNETVQLLAYLTTKSRQELLRMDSPGSQLLCSREEIAKIDIIKRHLEEMRYRLATPNCNIKALLPEMRKELKQLLSLCGWTQERPLSGIDREEMRIRVDSLKADMVPKKTLESDRSAKLKSEFALQLEKHLQNREKDSKEYVDFGTAPEFSKKEYLSIQNQSSPTKGNTKGERGESGGQFQGRTRKKRYNYLQQCQRQIQKIRIAEYGIDVFTPKIEKQGLKQALLSTKESGNTIDPLGDELQQIIPNDLRQDAVNLSNFDEFSQEDSIERDRARAQNLDDSLELMKQEENINRTAFFGVAVADRQEEGGHNYSFSDDI